MAVVPRQVLPPELLSRLQRHHGDALVGKVRRVLAEIGDTVVEQDVTIVFGGHFSCGKSSLLNVLLGRPLLPTDDFPETGVACWIGSGPQDRAVAVTTAGTTKSLQFSRHAISDVVSLVDQDGEYRSEVDAIEQVRLTVADEVVPPEVWWVDSPGINDSEATGERARRAAEEADVLVWVVDSRRPLSETEQSFLHQHQEKHGAGAVVFAVNVFLSADTPQQWARFLSERADYHRERIASLASWSHDGGMEDPDVVFVSARAAASDGFGGPQVRQLLSELGERSHPRIRAGRMRRAAAMVERLADTVAGHVQRERTGLDRERDLAATRREAVEQRRREFRKQVRHAVADCFTRHQAQAEQCGPDVVAELATDPLRWDDSYGTSLTTKFGAVADALAADLIASVTRSAARHRYSPPPQAALQQLTSLLQSGKLTVAVPNSPVGKAKGGLGAILGGAIGTVVLPGFGTALGALIGGAAGASSGAGDAVNYDRATGQAAARAAAASAAAALAGKQRQAVRLLLDSCTPLDAPAEEPGTDPLDALLALEENLRHKASEWTDHAKGPSTAWTRPTVAEGAP